LRAPDRISALKHLPIWIFHGAQDKRTPVTEAQAMDKMLRECGGNVRLTIYPDAGHDAWTRTYANPKLFEWLLVQKRESK
jgi:predicted peptidase